MSARYVSQVLNHSRARTATERLVLVALAAYQSDETGVQMRMRDLAYLARVSERSARRAVASLVVSTELVRFAQHDGDGGQRANVYGIDVPCPLGCEVHPSRPALRSEPLR